MSLLKFWREINKFDREVDVVKELAYAQSESEFLSGKEKEKVFADAHSELVTMHDEHIVWLYKDAIKTKLFNVALVGMVVVWGAGSVFKKS